MLYVGNPFVFKKMKINPYLSCLTKHLQCNNGERKLLTKMIRLVMSCDALITPTAVNFRILTFVLKKCQRLTIIFTNIRNINVILIYLKLVVKRCNFSQTNLHKFILALKVTSCETI